jgi:hypothetical protein
MNVHFVKKACPALLLILILVLTSLLSGMTSTSAAVAGLEKTDVFVVFHQMPGASEEALVKAFGGEIRYTYHLVPAIAASLPQAALQGLLQNPRVALIEPDLKAYALEEHYPWGITKIGADVVHAAGNKGAGVKVAVIDSGVDYSHPEIANNYKGGYDFVNKDNYPMDDNSHGTHVAGTLAAALGNNQGVIGVAPEVEIYALKVLGADGSGNFSNIVAAVQWCADNGIQVTNNSYGSFGDPGTTVKNAFDSAYSKGVLHVAAAGNDGDNRYARIYSDVVGYPAKYSSVIAVAATDNQNVRASFSSFGAAVELSAPGVSIESTIPGNKYASYSGTSMATPHVAGTAALVIKSGITGPANIRTQLKNTADDLGTAGWDKYYGYGLVNAKNAANVTMPGNAAPVVGITSPVSGGHFDSGVHISFAGTATDLEEGSLASGLVWTSSKDGPIGTGGTFAKELSDGDHTITASVTDSGGLTGSASVQVSVGSVAETSITVSDLTGKSMTVNKNFWKADVIVTVNSALSGAVVTGKWSNSTTVYSGTTDGSGKCTFNSGNLSTKSTSSVTFTIQNVTLSGYTYDSAGSEKSITISKP